MKLCKLVTLIALFGTSQGEAQREEEESPASGVQIGRCPYENNEGLSNIESLRLRELLGPWMEIYNEKGISDVGRCMGVRFDLLDEDTVAMS